MMKKNKLITCIITVVATMLLWPAPAHAQRKITPVNTPATATQAVNEFEGDTARIHARMRATMKHYHDENGNVIYIDTVTGREWVDSAVILVKRKPMQYPLMQSWSLSVDAWNPLMRVFGQKFGIIDFQAQLNLHNRYRPTIEMGIGQASDTPADMNFTYRTPLAWYMRIGADYNFLYNNSLDYQYVVGVRYGISPFSYSLDNISIESPYWGDVAHPRIPSQHALVGWFEFCTGLRVNISGPWSAGWLFRYHNILHQKKQAYGDPWYIPGYGSRNGSISGSIYVTYTFDLAKKKATENQEPAESQEHDESQKPRVESQEHSQSDPSDKSD